MKSLALLSILLCLSIDFTFGLESNIKVKPNDATNCENGVACQNPETKVPVLPDCRIKNTTMGIDIDIKQITKNLTIFDVPNIDNNPKMKMVLSICNGIPSSINCAGKATKTTCACLVNMDDGAKSENGATKSDIVGNIQKSFLRLTPDHIYLESKSTEKHCSVHGDSTVMKNFGFRVEFFCSDKEQNGPNYLRFDDCTYVFEWGSPLVCFNKLTSAGSSKIVSDTKKKDTTDIRSSSSKQPSSHDQSTEKTGADQHKETLSDSKEANRATPVHKNNISEHHVSPLNITLGLSGSKEDNGETPVHKNNLSEHHVSPLNITLGPVDSQSPSTTVAPKNATPARIQPVPRMDPSHKYFMICLITMSLVAFLAIILVLDKKTRLRVRLSSIRRYRQEFQTQSVPYSRVVNDIDL